MIRSLTPLVVLTVAACGAGGGDMRDPSADSANGGVIAQDMRACDVLDLAMATQVLGPGTEAPGGGTQQLACMYVNPGVAMLTVQLGAAAWYDQMTIMEPHAPVRIGDRGRSNVQERGAVAVQFVSGSHSATLSVQPIGGSRADYLELLTVAGREVARRLAG